MQDFPSIKKQAERDRTISNRVVDDFLIYYAATKDRLDKKVDRSLKRYRRILRKMPANWESMLKSQIIAHEIFKEGGRISAYLNHSDVKLRSREELAYLKRQAERPWKFMFAEILDNPSPYMCRMRDVFTGEECLTYSQGMSKMLANDQNIELWFFLSGYSGECIQTFGPIMHFRSFGRNDFAFFARCLDADLETGSEIDDHIQQQPIPYTMLWKDGLAPSVYHQEYKIEYQRADYYDDDFEAEPLYDLFGVEYTSGLYRFRLQKWSEFPHYATAYYHEKDSILYLTALTRAGFEHLVQALNRSGYDLSSEPHDAATPGMVTSASEVLGKEIEMNPFDSFFEPETDSDEDGLKEVNDFLGLLMVAINNNEKPDIEKMAEQAGIDFETASDLAGQVLGRFGK